MRVKMTTSISGTPSYMPGDRVDLSKAVAEEWIRDGMAVADPGPDAAPVDVGVGRAGDVETAVAPPAPERAVTAGPGPRRAARKRAPYQRRPKR